MMSIVAATAKTALLIPFFKYGCPKTIQNKGPVINNGSGVMCDKYQMLNIF
jgi:hypothetical protein